MRKLLQKIYQRIGMYLFAVLFFPGTFIHEMSHFLAALFLLVPVGKIELFPERIERGIKMGSVAIEKTDPVRRTLVGVAPIISGLTIIFISTSLTLPIWVHLIIVFEVGNTMFSSSEDLKGSWILFFLIPILFILKIDWSTIQKVDAFLAIPIGIDGLILLIIRVLKWKK